MELRKWTPKDRDAMVYLGNHVDRTHLTDRLPNPLTDKDADFWLSMIREQDGVRAVHRAIWVDGVLVGCIMAEQKADVYGKDAEVGYMLGKEFENRGIMTKAVSALIPLAFETLDILRLSASVNEPNLASRRVLEKNGFQLEGFQKSAVYKDGTVYNLCQYGLLKP